MDEDSVIALVGLVIGAIFLFLAYASTISKVTLVVFSPWVGRQIRYRDHPRTFIAVVFLYLFNSPFQPADGTREGAIRAFLILGSDAAPAIPQINRMLRNPETVVMAGNALFAIGTNSIPVLVDACAHTNRAVRAYCADVLAKLMGKGGYTTSYVPAGSTNKVYRFAFVMSDDDIDALASNLSHDDANARRASAEALGDRSRMRSTKLAVPALTKLLNDPNSAVREAALQALQKIQPDDFSGTAIK